MKDLNKQPKKNNNVNNARKQLKIKKKEMPVADTSLIDDIFKSAKQKKIIQKQSVDPQEIKNQKLEKKLKKQWRVEE